MPQADYLQIVDVRPIDPRDATWEVDTPAYRVYFWRGSASDEHRVTGAADIHEVLAWAEAGAGTDRTYTLYVEHMDGEHLGLIKLAGEDPTAQR